VAVEPVCEETFNLCRARVDEILLLDTDEICAEIQNVFEDTRSIVEPAGALAVVGIKKSINDLHYAYVEETNNPVYRMFLGA
jgi:threonine dehydratase